MFTKTIVYNQCNGIANRGAGNPQRYNKDGDRAEDTNVRETFSGSAEATWISVLGYVHAVPPMADESDLVQEDKAKATSFNKIHSRFVVTQDRIYTFEVELFLNGIEIKHDGWLKVDFSISVLNTRGIPIQATNSSFGNSYEISQSNGKTMIRKGNATPEPLHTDTYSDDLSTPDPGVNLSRGNYWVQIELNLTATAPTSIETTERSEAHINEGLIDVSLRN